ncbi:REP-associated tyrosine transposase [Desulforamulus aquiferis]|uniref:Transposase n=1 Tax=Desulforamulus aquiferis TaxID=1397668 RepID=A0AAW7Z9F2_9FIRM|nr:transposase [Desulforamulus aquiferis]MDO7785874.1 transposase [Desulforamulus aquiferis]
MMGDKMPRYARERSETGIYHIMMRGIDKRDIFIKDDDYEKFLHYIEKAKEKSGITLLAYCLMTNHLHLLIKEGKEQIGDSIKRISVGYAQYHNRKYGRTGHLFQNRYNSEPVNDEKYLLTVLRYIHQNPIKAGIVKVIGDYKWSSYLDYLKLQSRITDQDIAMGFFNNTEKFKEFHNQDNTDSCLGYEEKKRYTDEELKKEIKGIVEIQKLQFMETKERDSMIKRIKKETGASIRQLERALGIGRSIIQNAK